MNNKFTKNDIQKFDILGLGNGKEYIVQEDSKNRLYIKTSKNRVYIDEYCDNLDYPEDLAGIRTIIRVKRIPGDINEKEIPIIYEALDSFSIPLLTPIEYYMINKFNSQDSYIERDANNTVQIFVHKLTDYMVQIKTPLVKFLSKYYMINYLKSGDKPIPMEPLLNKYEENTKALIYNPNIPLINIKEYTQLKELSKEYHSLIRQEDNSDIYYTKNETLGWNTKPGYPIGTKDSLGVLKRLDLKPNKGHELNLLIRKFECNIFDKES